MNHNFFKLLTKELKFCFDLMDYILSRTLLTFREQFFASSVFLVLLSRKLEMYNNSVWTPDGQPKNQILNGLKCATT